MRWNSTFPIVRPLQLSNNSICTMCIALIDHLNECWARAFFRSFRFILFFCNLGIFGEFFMYYYYISTICANQFNECFTQRAIFSHFIYFFVSILFRLRRRITDFLFILWSVNDRAQAQPLDEHFSAIKNLNIIGKLANWVCCCVAVEQNIDFVWVTIAFTIVRYLRCLPHSCSDFWKPNEHQKINEKKKSWDETSALTKHAHILAAHSTN